ncbi:hypothetical protein Smp_198600 [Schistosoma mansoni]|uniref:hypothetical protein n=1 Tax=Schistosoma mansoni TaxID=6183 RepID=UPI00022DC86F|nr:hypothetical protein Smp_198600 [Schistosoma mansoni]|eukprot:XP_018653945.1 hypothetical protein Smp_198600 [Schistosoma mansoni]
MIVIVLNGDDDDDGQYIFVCCQHISLMTHLKIKKFTILIKVKILCTLNSSCVVI